MRKLIWFRQDLRITDHVALWHATQQAQCIAYVVLSPEQWNQHHDAPIKIDFYLRQLKKLKEQLNQLNIPLIIQIIPLWKDVAFSLNKLCTQLNIQEVHANLELGVNELNRDQHCLKILAQSQITFHLHQDRTLFPVGKIRNQSGQPYKIFTAFKHQCYQHLSFQIPVCFPEIQAQAPADFHLESYQEYIPQLSDLGYPPVASHIQALWQVGEDFAQQQLDQFIENDLASYQQQRDFPALSATSCLSAYLNIGILSIRQCLQALFRAEHGQFNIQNQGQQSWLDELLWREFYQHILFDFHQVSKHQPFQIKTNKIQWREDPVSLQAWQQGQTGIPIIDAGMRQLLATGWMHNRVRMICAMFLSKNLLIDWRKGEQWFMQQLVDGELAANNGGWQWCASTGTDAVPYFRIFNPVEQSKRFDPQGDYIKQWLPELRHLDAKTIHAPYAKSDQINLNYPKPIVDLKTSRIRALEAFKSL